METGGAPAVAGVDSQRPAQALPHVFAETIRGREPFLKLKADWDAALAEGPDPSPALEHSFLRLWLETFAPSQQPIIVTARRGRGLTAAMGVTSGTALVDGVPMQLARGWSNAHSTRGGPLMGAAGAVALVPVVHRLCNEPWDALVLRDVPRDASCLDVLTQAFREEGCAVAFESPMDSPYVPLPSDWSEVEQRLDARFRQNVRRRRRRLEEHGPVRFEVITGADGLDAALEDALAIEASGWKGAEGSAIRARPELVSFYASWARQLAASGRLRLCFLTASDRRIAFQFGFVQGKRYYLPKCGFDESFQECSPGQLLTAEVLRRCIDEHLDTFEFLGFSMPWKRDWTPLVRPHATLWAFRPTLRGQWARAMRAEIRPRAAAFWNDVSTRLQRRRNPA